MKIGLAERLKSTRVLHNTRKPAPVDIGFGDKGYAFVAKRNDRIHSLCNDIIPSRSHTNSYYAATKLYEHQADGHTAFIARFDQKGNIDNTFKIDIESHLNEGRFTPEQLFEDLNGKLLCLGTHSVEGTSDTLIWRFNSDGTLDTTFNEKGYIQADALLGDGGFIRIVGHPQGYTVSCIKSQKPMLASLNSDGSLNKGFGDQGYVDLAGQFPYPISAGAGFFIATLGEKTLLLTLAGSGDDFSSLLACFTSHGILDNTFADQGYYKAQNNTAYYRFSINDTAKAVTLFGAHYNAEEDQLYPEIFRLDDKGQPLEQFNGGSPARFELPGGWEHIHEFNGRLAGWGGFYTHNRVVCYTLEGKLDTTFVPEDGHGELGVPVYRDGFNPQYAASIAFTSAENRMFVCGQYFYNNDTSVDAAVTAISYK